jgi:transcriptional regulator with XRE-family HTH domain
MAQSPDSTDGSRPGTDEFLIGSKLREWRLGAGRTLSDIAEASSLSIGYISQIERGMANPSLETLKRLADELDHRVGELFIEPDAESTPSRYAVTRRGMRKQIYFPGSGILNELLSPDLKHQMEVIWVQAPVGAESGDHPHSHEGEECGFVFAGEMILRIGGDEVVLGAGDSVYLDSSTPHRWRAAGQEELQAIWLITPPTF